MYYYEVEYRWDCDIDIEEYYADDLADGVPADMIWEAHSQTRQMLIPAEEGSYIHPDNQCLCHLEDDLLEMVSDDCDWCIEDFALVALYKGTEKIIDYTL